ncbi:MAG TPA: fibronectin type III domain-containing protein [Micromonosporaceae bacterium]|jgi:hypothetical protein
MRAARITACLAAVVIPLGFVISTVSAAAVAANSIAPAVADTVDEIHYSYGDGPGTVVLGWRGSATTVDFGAAAAYGATVTATVSPITPVDIAGPFMRATLTGLAPDTTYHYRIGPSGIDHTLSSAPTGSKRGYRQMRAG